MTPVATVIDESPSIQSEPTASTLRSSFRVRPIMRQGTASSIPETWRPYMTLEEARQVVKQMYHNDRVLRVFIVTDTAPPQFVEWVDR